MKKNHLYLAAGIALLFSLFSLPSQSQESNKKTLESVTSLTELASWLEENPPEVVNLSGITGKRILTQSLATLRQNVDQLQTYLRSNGEIGMKWAKVLYLDELKTAINAKSPNLEELQSIHKHFHSHQWGLEVTEIRRVAKGLHNYILLRITIEENIDPSDGLKEAINRLITALKKTNKSTLETTAEINEIVNWLEDNQQAPEICQTIRRLTEKHNLYAQISDNLALKFISRPVNQTQQITDNIAGKQQNGNVHIVGEVSGKFNPDPNKINLSVILNGVASGITVTQTRNVTVTASSTNTLYAIKDILFDSQQLSSPPARSYVQIRSTITGINSPGGLVQSIAVNRINEMKPQADAEAALKARIRLESALNKELGSLIAKANNQFKQTSEMYRIRGLYPNPFNCSTTEHSLKFYAHISDGIPIIPQEAPEAPDKSDIFIAVHQSAIIESCKAMLADLKANQRVFMAIARSMLPENAYNELSKKAADNKNNNATAIDGNIYFNAQYPVSIQFTNNTIVIDLRIDAFQGKDGATPQEIPMNLSTAYKIEKIDKNGIWFVRIKEPELVPRDFETGVRKLTTPETTLRNRLQGDLKNSFPPSFQINPLKLDDISEKRNPDAIKLTGTIRPVSAKAANGWLTINWLYQE